MKNRNEHQLPAELQEQTGEKAVKLWDESDPRSLINLLPKTMVQRLKDAPKSYYHYTERVLENRIQPVPEMKMLRLAFWREFGSAIDSGRRMKNENVYAGICHSGKYYALLDQGKNMAYMTIPPPSYQAQLENLLSRAMLELERIMELPNFDSKGKMHSGLIGHKVKAAEMIQNRVMGNTLQKLAVHQHHTGQIETTPAPVKTIEDIDARIKEIEADEDS